MSIFVPSCFVFRYRSGPNLSDLFQVWSHRQVSMERESIDSIMTSTSNSTSRACRLHRKLFFGSHLVGENHPPMIRLAPPSLSIPRRLKTMNPPLRDPHFRRTTSPFPMLLKSTPRRGLAIESLG